MYATPAAPRGIRRVSGRLRTVSSGAERIQSEDRNAGERSDLLGALF
jgi:hypothetical protein